jgi:Protein of unknown function (DUF2946)
MQRISDSPHTIWRSIVGCIIAYALVINALLSGLLGAERVAQAAAGLVGEHCLMDARTAGTDPSPTGQPDDSFHCAFCILAVGPAVLPATPVAGLIVTLRADAFSSASDRDLPHGHGHPGKLPRGPPQAVTET